MDTSTESSQPSLLNLDWLLIAIGSAILSLVPTFLALLITPARLTPRLSGQFPKGERTFLGPGQFFVLSVITLVLMGSVIRRDNLTDDAEVASSMSNAPTYNAGATVGEAMKRFIENTGERLASGDVWSAAMIALPIFLFAVALGCVIAALMALLKRTSADGPLNWNVRHAMGASLYMVGGLTLWNSLLLILPTLLPMQDFPLMVNGLIFIAMFFAAFISLGWQTYSFASQSGIKEGSGLFFGASLVPIAVIILLTLWIVIAI